MKKVKKTYKNSTVHPSPPPPLISDHLSLLLPTAIFTLTITLSPQDKEILAYLLSKKTTTNHSPLFNCSCFKCYMSYWVRWDSSPNRHLIHQIIDAVENGLVVQTHKHKSKKHRKNKPFPTTSTITNNNNNITITTTNINNNDNDNIKSCDESEGGAGAESTRSMEVSQPSVNEFEEEEEGGTVMRKLVSLIGERIWSVWT